MADNGIKVGTRVRVVSFDEEGITGDIYTDEYSLIGLEGTVIDGAEGIWTVRFPRDVRDNLYIPNYFYASELEVIDDNPEKEST